MRQTAREVRLPYQMVYRVVPLDWDTRNWSRRGVQRLAEIYGTPPASPGVLRSFGASNSDDGTRAYPKKISKTDLGLILILRWLHRKKLGIHYSQWLQEAARQVRLPCAPTIPKFGDILIHTGR